MWYGEAEQKLELHPQWYDIVDKGEKWDNIT